jgi:segregation and condensation protein B
MQDIRHIIESLLFVAEEPLTIDKLKSVLETIEVKEIRTALQTLADQYDARGGGFMLCEVAGGWQLRSRPAYNEWIKRLLQPSPQRLSKPALETLAIVAYNQPIIRADVEHIRGVDCGGVLRQLMERKLVRVLGRKEIPGRPLIYATTKLFLELFGLKDLKDLPSPKEIEEMAAAMEATHPDPSTDFEGLRAIDTLKTSDHYFHEDDTIAQKTPVEETLPGPQEPALRATVMTTAEPAMRKNCRQPGRAYPFLNPEPRIGSQPSRVAGKSHPLQTGPKNRIGG